MPDAPTSSDYVPLVSSTKATLVNFDPVTVAKNGEATICLTLQLEEGFELSHEPASLYQVVPSCKRNVFNLLLIMFCLQ